MIQLSHDEVAKMSPEMQRLVGYGETLEGLGFTEKGPPAALLGEGQESHMRGLPPWAETFPKPFKPFNTFQTPFKTFQKPFKNLSKPFNPTPQSRSERF